MPDINKDSVKNHSIENLQTKLAECVKTIADAKYGTPQNSKYWLAVEHKFIINRELFVREKSTSAN